MQNYGIPDPDLILKEIKYPKVKLHMATTNPNLSIEDRLSRLESLLERFVSVTPAAS